MPKILRFHFFLLSFYMIDVGAEPMIIDDFTSNDQPQWNYVSDQVMGGISEGILVFRTDKEESYAQLTGEVSTKNNGGFIQFRRDLIIPDTQGVQGIYAKVKGNNQKYFIHIRTRGTIMPWQYYQSEFLAGDKWQSIKLPFNNFVASSQWIKKELRAKDVRSIGVVAFGRDHKADINVSEIGFF
ncbi:MAG: CIA30 family protein [Porticoccaceae bacterium]|nr:CIA30 family protein [Porticoccaceae bacterium]